ncbi:hypothetical protein N9O57_01765 [bacterium]|nr:hypothetical protein [bacterium]
MHSTSLIGKTMRILQVLKFISFFICFNLFSGSSNIELNGRVIAFDKESIIVRTDFGKVKIKKKDFLGDAPKGLKGGEDIKVILKKRIKHISILK